MALRDLWAVVETQGLGGIVALSLAVSIAAAALAGALGAALGAALAVSRIPSRRIATDVIAGIGCGALFTVVSAAASEQKSAGRSKG